jgi:hypothetical protein
MLAGTLVAHMWKQRRKRREWDNGIELEAPRDFESDCDHEGGSLCESEIDLTAIDNEENV